MRCGKLYHGSILSISIHKVDWCQRMKRLDIIIFDLIYKNIVNKCISFRHYDIQSELLVNNIYKWSFLSFALIPRQSFTSSVMFINATHQSHMRGCTKCMRIATSSKQHMKRGSETKGLYVILVRKDYKTSHVQLVNIIRNCIY